MQESKRVALFQKNDRQIDRSMEKKKGWKDTEMKRKKKGWRNEGLRNKNMQNERMGKMNE